MASRGDVEKLRRVYADYENPIVSKLDFNVVDVTTVVDLDDNLRTVIKNKIKNDLGRDCSSSSIKHPSILGGIVTSHDGQLYRRKPSLAVRSSAHRDERKDRWR